MTQQTFYYIGTALIVGLGALIGWYIKYSIKKQKEDKENIRKEFEELKRLFTGFSEKIGFMQSKQIEHGNALDRHGDRLLELEKGLTHLKTLMEMCK